MSKVLCAISGIEFNCDHLPIRLYGREMSHPIFHLKQQKLLGVYGKYIQGNLTETDSYLLYLAFFNSTGLMRWDVPAQKTHNSASIIANNIESLVRIVGLIGATSKLTEQCARIAVTSENKELNSSHIWINVWMNNYIDFCDGYRIQEQKVKLRLQETHLQRLIKNSNKEISAYAKRLANWAMLAGNFPLEQVTNRLTGKQSTRSQYWQDLIIACTKDERVFDIDNRDLKELIEYCEVNITEGSIYSHSLFELLKHGYHRQKNYLGFGDLDISQHAFRILTPEQTAEDANIMAIIDNAPTEMPKLESYPSRFLWLKAKSNYELALKYKANMPAKTESIHPILSDIPINQLTAMFDMNAEELDTSSMIHKPDETESKPQLGDLNV